MTLLYTDTSAARHLTPPGHPEQVARHAAVLGALAPLDLPRRDCPLADEGDILRYVFFHSIALAVLVGLFVMLQAYVYPFTLMVP